MRQMHLLKLISEVLNRIKLSLTICNFCKNNPVDQNPRVCRRNESAFDVIKKRHQKKRCTSSACQRSANGYQRDK